MSRVLQVPYPASEENWWEAGGATGCVIALDAWAAANYAASLVNLTGGADATTGDAPTLDVGNGWVFDGVGDYIVAPFIFLTDWSMFIQFADVGATGTLVICGASDGTNRSMLAPTRDVGSATYYYGTGNQSVAPQMTSGNIALVADIGYRNGIADTTSIGSFSASHGLGSYIGCVNANNTPALFVPCTVKRFAMYNNTLSPSQALAVADAMATPP